VTLSTVTVNELAEAVVALRVSLYDSDNTFPEVLNDAESNVGGVTSPTTVELFVTALSVNASASLPKVSWTAKFVVELSIGGATYDTVTV
jgi:hypothetical protein